MRGAIERVADDRVSGWVINDLDFEDRPMVRLYIDGELVDECLAQNFRADLLDNSVGDGRHGFGFNRKEGLDYPKAYLEGRLKAEAELDGRVIRVAEASFLERETRERQILGGLGTYGFDHFIGEMTGFASVGLSLHHLQVMNGSRAHFPEWRTSQPFLSLAADMAERLEQPHTAKFYRTILSALDGGTPLPELTYGRYPRQEEGQYAAFSDLAATGGLRPIRLIPPRFLGEGHPQSFVEEVGIIPGGDTGENAIPVLAFREYAFGEPTWMVRREGKRQRVVRQLYYLNFETLLETLDAGGIVCMDMSNEAPEYFEHWNDVIVSALRDLAIPQDRFLYLTQNLAYTVPDRTSDFFGEIGYGHYFISRSLRRLGDTFATDEAIGAHIRRVLGTRKTRPQGSKDFICLNFTPRWQRWAVVLFLLQRGYMDRGLISFTGQNFKMLDRADLQGSMPDFGLKTELLSLVDRLVEMCPMTLDVALDTNLTPTDDFPIEMMSTTLFQIVTESEMDGAQKRRVTEKVLKPIMGLQPFIIAGNAGSLKLLRSMGFRTFSPVIDESYDRIVDPGRRLAAVYDEIDRLLAMPSDKLQATFEELNEIVIHNFIHFVRMSSTLFMGGVGERIRRKINGMVRK